MSKKNLLHLLAIMMVAMLSVGFASCGDDDDDDYVPKGGGQATTTTTASETSSDDPEGTIITNLSCGNSLSFSGFPSDCQFYLYLSKDYNFGINSQSAYRVAESSYIKYFADIVSIGSIKGLSSITKVPEKGWTNKTAAIPEYGYVVRYKYGYFSSDEEMSRADVDALPNVAYVRLYVTDYITNNSDGGCTIKYQVWKP